MKARLIKWECQATGDIFFSEDPPQTKDIEQERFIEVTTDFKRAHYIKADSVKKIGSITKEFK